MELLIVRHGQTDWNLEGRIQGKVDISLNQTGMEQAIEIKKKLDNIDIDLIICSPLKRAKQTAEVINRNRDIQIIYDDKISERDFGEFEGKRKNEFDFEGFWNYSKNYKYKRAENIRSFFYRIYSRLDEIKCDYKEKRILLVAHGGVSIPVNCYFNTIPEDGEVLKFALGNCEVAKFS